MKALLDILHSCEHGKTCISFYDFLLNCLFQLVDKIIIQFALAKRASSFFNFIFIGG